MALINAAVQSDDIFEDVARFWKSNPRGTSWQRVVKAMKLAAPEASASRRTRPYPLTHVILIRFPWEL